MSVVGSIVTGSVDALMDVRPTAHPSRCSRAASPRSRCALCARYCPSQSVSITASGPSLHTTCTGCDICLAVCPDAVFSRPGLTDEALLMRLLASRRDRALTIACTASHGAAASVRCLGRLNALLLFHLAAAGIDDITLEMGPCARCSLVRGLGHLADGIDAGVRLARSVGVELRVKKACGDDDSGRPPGRSSRRELFGIFRRTNPAPALPSARSPIMHPELRRSARAILSTRLTEFVEPAGRCWPFWQVAVDAARCSGCKACSAVCAASALMRQERADTVRLSFDPGECTGCGACVSTCRTGALTLEPARLDAVLRGEATLFMTAVHRCRLCGQLVPGEADGPCMLCARRR